MLKAEENQKAGNPGFGRGGRSIVQRAPACPRTGRSAASARGLEQSFSTGLTHWPAPVPHTNSSALSATALPGNHCLPARFGIPGTAPVQPGPSGNLQPQRIRDLDQSPQACRRVVLRLVALNLLLLESHSLGQLALRQAQGDPRLDQQVRQLAQAAHLQVSDAAGFKGFILP